MPTGDPMWQCPHCGQIYYTNCQTYCLCPMAAEVRERYKPMYEDIVKCPCKKSWVPKGFEHQCPHCKGKKSLQDVWAEMWESKPSYPVDMSTPTNSKPMNIPLTPKNDLNKVYEDVFGVPPKAAPKKESIRINLPPKPFSGEYVGSKSKNVAADFKLGETAWEEFSVRQDEIELQEMLDGLVEEERRKDDLTAREVLSNAILKKSCQCCGNKRIAIRGRYPKDEQRIVCPTCMADTLDMIREIINPSYRQTYTENK